MTDPAANETFILIRGRGRVSALGGQVGPESLASPFSTHAAGLPVAALPAAAEAAVAELQRTHPTYRQLDRTVLLALLATRAAAAQAGWRPAEGDEERRGTTTFSSRSTTIVAQPAAAETGAAGEAGTLPDGGAGASAVSNDILDGADKPVASNDMSDGGFGAPAVSIDVPNGGADKPAVSNDSGATTEKSRSTTSPTPPATQHSTLNPQHSLAVSIGSSRGATHHLEHYHAGFLREGAVPAAASPLTTLGNVASWVAFDAGAVGGAALSHSSTCSSAFQALGNAVAWLRAGLADRFLAGGAEAPLTAFTLAQLRAIGIYSPLAAADWPCQPGAGRPATFVLGEGAAVFALEQVGAAAAAAAVAAAPGRPLLRLESVGFGFEAIGSKTGLSPDGQHFQTAMRRALHQASRAPAAVDALVLHSPGTPAGDAAELAAVRAVFGETLPALLSNKWLIGHTLGASAALSLDFALEVLTTQQWPAPPFATYLTAAPTRPIRRVLVNAAGFGGNAASALVSLVG